MNFNMNKMSIMKNAEERMEQSGNLTYLFNEGRLI